MASQRIASLAPAQPGHGLDRPGTLITRAGQVLVAWRARAGQRRRLAELDDRMLRDIGLTRADVRMELEKPFWRL